MLDKSSHIIGKDEALIGAIDRLNRLPGGLMTLFVVDDYGHLVGALTDGDIRRAILRGIDLSEPVEKAMFIGVRALHPNINSTSVIADARKIGVRLIPRLDIDGRILEIADIQAINTSLPVDAVLMAGGRGERLRPATLNTPKPLLPIDGKPIIDYNIDALAKAGVKNIYVTVNYLHEQIENHLAKPRTDGVDVRCILEPTRLGTMGAVSLIDTFKSPDVLIMNSDLLTTLNFDDMYQRHVDTHADITMAVTNYTVSVPFAIVETDEDNRVKQLAEKPVYNYFANAGVYIVRRELLNRLHSGEYMDAPDFISSACTDGFNVRTFPIVGTWIDIGSPDDFRTAEEFMRSRH